MKKLLLVGCSLFAAYGFTQTTIYQEDFETGNSFTLNTTDLGGASAQNTWLVNNAYTGGSGTLICLGFPFTFTIANTPAQPGGVAGAPNSTYMHIASQAAISSGIFNASFAASDGGTCIPNESNFARMTTPISTVGFTNVELDFYWTCVGGASAVGEVYYSLNGGTTWTLKQGNFNNTGSWTQTTLSDPLWDNEASLLFAFRFLNNTSPSAADPSFSVDQITVSGTAGSSNTITTTAIQPQTSWCTGNTTILQVSFDATGTYNAANVFTAELSDGAGSFAAPLSVGTLNSSSSGTQVISAIIPGGTVPANGYRIRVVASDPTTIGTDNGTDLVIHPLPTVTQSSFADVCLNDTPITLTGGSPAGGVYSGTGVSGGMFDPSVAGSGTSNIVYTYTDNNGCEGIIVEPIQVLPAPTVSQTPFVAVCSNANPINLVGGSPAGGTYSGTGVSGASFDPSVAGAGTTNITYTYTDNNGCEGTATESILVNQAPTVTFDAVPDQCDDDPDYTLVATPSGGSFTGPGVVGNVFSPSSVGVGTYTLFYEYTDGNGCSEQGTQVVNVDGCSSVAEETLAYSIYPNPAEGFFSVISDVEFESIALRDVNGKLIQQFAANEQVNVSTLSSGVYLVELIHAGQRYTERIVLK
jgi:hypothetical protein